MQQSLSDAAADSRVGSSVVLDTLLDEEGWLGLYETLGSEFFDLLIDGGNHVDLAHALLEAVYQIPDIDWIAPFDGTIQAELEDGETEKDWALNNDILPFLERWSNVLLEDEPKVWPR